MDDYRYRSLQTLTRARFDAVQNLTREKQRFANYLFLKCSGIAQSKDIPNTSATTLAIMENFETVDDLANCDLETLTAFVSAAGRGRFADPEATAKAVQAAAKGSYRLPKTVNDSINQAMSRCPLHLCVPWRARSRYWKKPLSSSLRSFPIP